MESAAVAEGKTVDELARDYIDAQLKRSRLSQTAKAAYKPETHLRERVIVPKEAALLFIDVQNYNCHPSGVEAAHFGKASCLMQWGELVAAYVVLLAAWAIASNLSSVAFPSILLVYTGLDLWPDQRLHCLNTK